MLFSFQGTKVYKKCGRQLPTSHNKYNLHIFKYTMELYRISHRYDFAGGLVPFILMEHQKYTISAQPALDKCLYN